MIILDADTIQVQGNRVPGGWGFWRYHLHDDCWEQVPSYEISQPDDDTFELPPAPYLSHWYGDGAPIYVPRDAKPLLLCRSVSEYTREDGEDQLTSQQTKHIIEYRVADGTQQELGVIHHSPLSADCAMLPDGSGFWVKEEEAIAGCEWVHPVVHIYDLRSRLWRTVTCRNIYSARKPRGRSV